MKILIQLAIIFAATFVGEFISSVLPFTFPAAIIALFLLLICMLAGLVREEQIGETSDFLLANLGFFFVPAGVRLLELYEVITPVLWEFLLICVLSTVAVFFVTGNAVKLTLYLQRKFSRRREAQNG